MDPMELMRKAISNGKIPSEYERKIEPGLVKAKDAIKKVEKATGAKYPIWYVLPYAIIMKGGNLDSEAIVYSRFMPLSNENTLLLTVEFTAPLILFGSKDTVASAVAHEFLHYINFLALLKDRRLGSSSPTDHVIEALYADEGELYNADLIYSKSRYLKRVLAEKFKDGLNDEALNKKTITRWINAGLPTLVISPSENRITISMFAVMNYVPEEGARRLINWT